MEIQFARYIAAARRTGELSPQDLAARMGYKNLNRGARRIGDVEAGAFPDEALFDKLVSALELPREDALRALENSRKAAQEEYGKWLDEPVDPVLVIRLVGAVCITYHPPEHLLSEDALIDWAREKVIPLRQGGCLELSRRETIVFDKNGEVTNRVFNDGRLPEGFQPNRKHTGLNLNLDPLCLSRRVFW